MSGPQANAVLEVGGYYRNGVMERSWRVRILLMPIRLEKNAIIITL
jgi:hypothetical protein